MINNNLINYIENNIFPVYSLNDKGHDISHIKYVINRSIRFASTINDINMDMVYTIAAYHDIAHHLDPENHESLSANVLEKDENLRVFFSEEEIKVMSEAISDHRASKNGEPRSIYGKIVSSADRNTDLDTIIRRTYLYRIKNYPNMELDEIIGESLKHIEEKFGANGYANNKMYFIDEEYNKFLEDVNNITSDEDEFKKRYLLVNNL